MPGVRKRPSDYSQPSKNRFKKDLNALVLLQDILKGICNSSELFFSEPEGAELEIFCKPGLDAVNIAFLEFPVKEVPSVLDFLRDLIETRGFEEHKVVRMGFLPALDKAHAFKL
jgi:hypothetical protein